MTSKKKILIADPSPELHKKISSAPAAAHYLLETAQTGPECLKKIKSFAPNLLLADLLLPEMHGIEILRKMKSDSHLKQCGVIITTEYALIQNYHAAIQEGAIYFLNKPFTPDEFFALVERFFLGQLKPDPFQGVSSRERHGEHCYVPKMHRPQHYLHFWGTRGSNAVSGPEYIRFGGNTCCLEIRYGDHLLIIDAGTGIRRFGESVLLPHSKKFHLFFSHTHWDHLTGFPFFYPLYDPSCHITLWAPIGFEKSPRELFTDMLAYSFFPVRLDDIKAKITFEDLRDLQTIKIGEIEISTHYTFHPGATLCFKIATPEKTFAYVTDNEFLMGYHGHPNAVKKDHPFLAPHYSLIEFLKGCDFLIHEAQYFPQEYLHKVGWGHSSLSNAVALIKETHTKEWIVTHHDPSHTDILLEKKIQLLRDILEDCHISVQVRFAFDGLRIPL
jgi:CheY-like chemotaxis protein/ribonuclease BN (tRNA processing enzyme)